MQTLKAFVSYLLKHSVQMLIFENVDTIETEDVAPSTEAQTQSILDWIVSRFRQAGFRNLTILSDPPEFGVPQSRRRFYIVGVNTIGSTLFDFASGLVDSKQLMQNLRENLQKCKRTAPCLTKVLFNADAPSVEQDLNRALKERRPIIEGSHCSQPT